MNLVTIRSRRWPAALALISILGLAGARAAADPPTPQSVQPNKVPSASQPETSETPDSPETKKTDAQPERPWWDADPGPRDDQPAEEGMTLPPRLSPKPERNGFRDLENELRRRAEMILRELVELPAGRDAESQRLESELKRVREEIERLHKDFGRLERGPGAPAPDLFELLGERLELAQRAVDVQCLIYELGDENGEQVGDLKDELKQINARLEEIVARNPELKNDRQFLKMQLEFYRRAAQRMRQVGKPEAAERFTRDQLAIIQRLEGPAAAEPPTAAGDALDRRIKHVEAAIENLRAAGLHDFAESLVRELQRMVDEHRLQGPGFAVPPGRFAPLEMLETPYPAQGGEPGTAELHRQVDQMRRETDELRKLVEKLLEENRRGKPD